MTGRIRTIKPEWIEDELLAAASDEARVLSVALILMADDHGRGRASVAAIASGAWRYQLEHDDGAQAAQVLARASRALRELHAIRFVVLYKVSGQQYYEIRNWARHQRVDRPSKPRVPPPETEQISTQTAEEPADSRQSHEDVSRPSRDPRETLATDLRPPTSDLRSPTTSTDHACVREGPTPAGIVEAALASAIGAAGGRLIPRTGDATHLVQAAEAITASDARPLRQVAEEWAAHFVGEYRVRSPKNFADYAQSRAANGGAKLPLPNGKRTGWQEPATHERFTQTDIDQAFRRET